MAEKAEICTEGASKVTEIHEINSQLLANCSGATPAAGSGKEYLPCLAGENDLRHLQQALDLYLVMKTVDPVKISNTEILPNFQAQV